MSSGRSTHFAISSSIEKKSALQTNTFPLDSDDDNSLLFRKRDNKRKDKSEMKQRNTNRISVNDIVKLQKEDSFSDESSLFSDNSFTTIDLKATLPARIGKVNPREVLSQINQANSQLSSDNALIAEAANRLQKHFTLNTNDQSQIIDNDVSLMPSDHNLSISFAPAPRKNEPIPSETRTIKHKRFTFQDNSQLSHKNNIYEIEQPKISPNQYEPHGSFSSNFTHISERLEQEKEHNEKLRAQLENHKTETQSLKEEIEDQRKRSKNERSEYKEELSKQIRNFENLQEKNNDDPNSIRSVKLEAAKEIARVKAEALEREAFYRRDIDSLTQRLSSAQSTISQMESEHNLSQQNSLSVAQRELKSASKLKDACNEQKKRLDEQEHTLADREKQILSAKSELEKMTKAASQLKYSTEQKNEQLKMKESQIAEKEKLVEALETDWKKRMSSIERSQQQMAADKSKLAELAGVLRVRESELRLLENTLEDGAEGMRRKLKSVSQKETLLNSTVSKTKEHEELSQKIDKRKTELELQSIECEKKSNSLIERENTIKEKELELKSKQEELNLTAKQLKTQEQQIKDSMTEMNTLMNEIHAAQQALLDRETKANKQQNEMQSLKIKVEESAKIIEEKTSICERNFEQNERMHKHILEEQKRLQELSSELSKREQSFSKRELRNAQKEALMEETEEQLHKEQERLTREKELTEITVKEARKTVATQFQKVKTTDLREIELSKREELVVKKEAALAQLELLKQELLQKEREVIMKQNSTKEIMEQIKVEKENLDKRFEVLKASQVALEKQKAEMLAQITTKETNIMTNDEKTKSYLANVKMFQETLATKELQLQQWENELNSRSSKQESVLSATEKNLRREIAELEQTKSLKKAEYDQLLADIETSKIEHSKLLESGKQQRIGIEYRLRHTQSEIAEREKTLTKSQIQFEQITKETQQKLLQQKIEHDELRQRNEVEKQQLNQRERLLQARQEVIEQAQESLIKIKTENEKGIQIERKSLDQEKKQADEMIKEAKTLLTKANSERESLEYLRHQLKAKESDLQRREELMEESQKELLNISVRTEQQDHSVKSEKVRLKSMMDNVEQRSADLDRLSIELSHREKILSEKEAEFSNKKLHIDSERETFEREKERSKKEREELHRLRTTIETQLEALKLQSTKLEHKNKDLSQMDSKIQHTSFALEEQKLQLKSKQEMIAQQSNELIETQAKLRERENALVQKEAELKTRIALDEQTAANSKRELTEFEHNLHAMKQALEEEKRSLDLQQQKLEQMRLSFDRIEKEKNDRISHQYAQLRKVSIEQEQEKRSIAEKQEEIRLQREKEMQNYVQRNALTEKKEQEIQKRDKLLMEKENALAERESSLGAQFERLRVEAELKKVEIESVNASQKRVEQREKAFEEQRFAFEQEKAKFELEIARKKQEIFALGEQVSQRIKKGEMTHPTIADHFQDIRESDTLLPTVRGFENENVHLISRKQHSNNIFGLNQNTDSNRFENASKLYHNKKQEFPLSAPSTPSVNKLENEWETIISGKTMKDKVPKSDIEEIAFTTQRSKEQLKKLQNLLQSLQNVNHGQTNETVHQFVEQVSMLESELNALVPTKKEVIAKGISAKTALQRLREKTKGQMVWNKQATAVEKELKQTLENLNSQNNISTIGTQNWANFRKVVQLEREVLAKPEQFNFTEPSSIIENPYTKQRIEKDKAKTDNSLMAYDDFEFDPEKLKKQLDSDKRKTNQANFIYLDRTLQGPTEIPNEAFGKL